MTLGILHAVIRLRLCQVRQSMTSMESRWSLTKEETLLNRPSRAHY